MSFKTSFLIPKSLSDWVITEMPSRAGVVQAAMGSL